MTLIGYRHIAANVAMSAGTNVVDIVVPPKHAYHLTGYSLLNPDAVSRTLLVEITDAAGNRLNIINYVAVGAAHWGARLADTDNNVNYNAMWVFPAGIKIRITFAAMTGGNTASYVVNVGVHRDGGA